MDRSRGLRRLVRALQDGINIRDTEDRGVINRHIIWGLKLPTEGAKTKRGGRPHKYITVGQGKCKVQNIRGAATANVWLSMLSSSSSLLATLARKISFTLEDYKKSELFPGAILSRTHLQKSVHRHTESPQLLVILSLY